MCGVGGVGYIVFIMSNPATDEIQIVLWLSLGCDKYEMNNPSGAANESYPMLTDHCYYPFISGFFYHNFTIGGEHSN